MKSAFYKSHLVLCILIGPWEMYIKDMHITIILVQDFLTGILFYVVLLSQFTVQSSSSSSEVLKCISMASALPPPLCLPSTQVQYDRHNNPVSLAIHIHVANAEGMQTIIYLV